MKFGFNAILDEAKTELEKLGIKMTPSGQGSWTDIEVRDDFRVWKNPINGYYYYLFGEGEKVFRARNNTVKDYNTTPPTETVVCVLELANKEYQRHYIEFLGSLPPNTSEGGHLV